MLNKNTWDSVQARLDAIGDDLVLNKANNHRMKLHLKETLFNLNKILKRGVTTTEYKKYEMLKIGYEQAIHVLNIGEKMIKEKGDVI